MTTRPPDADRTGEDATEAPTTTGRHARERHTPERRAAGPATLALFSVATVAIFALWYATGEGSDRHDERRITLTADQAAPALDAAGHRLERLVADEVSVREAAATGLHRTDEAARQRLEQLGLAALTRELGGPDEAEQWLHEQIAAHIDCGAAVVVPSQD